MSFRQWDALISNPFRPMENKAIQGEYPPGSTYKIVTAIAGLEDGVIDESSEVDCYGYHRFGNRIYRCWKKSGHGRVDIYRALAESCDVYFYQVGQKLGVDRLAWYAKACGLGSKTGINLDQEANGLIPTAAWKKARIGVSWQKGETLSLAIGQGFNLATPLQMAALAAAVGNGGTRYQPVIWDSIRDASNQIIQRTEPRVIGKLPASEKTLAIVRRGLWGAVNGEKGTARRIHSAHIEISGKTGTSQVVSRRSTEGLKASEIPAHMRAHAWFVAYAPSNQPRIAVAVIIEHGEHGSSAAAPIAKEMIRAYLRPADGRSAVAQNDDSVLSEQGG
jgi:penicillin-binding protein 2